MDSNEIMKESIVGCADPYSIAENIVGRVIDWEREEDEIDSLAACFGITKEGFLSAESPIESPYLMVDVNGNVRRLSDAEAERRVSAFLRKYARPRKRASRLRSRLPDQDEKQVLDAVLKCSARSARNASVPKLTRKSLMDQASGDKKEEPQKKDDPQKDTDTYTWMEKGYFFNECVLWSDVCQNSIGDCYFLATLCSVAYARPFEIQNRAALRYVCREGCKYLSPWHEIDFYVPKTNHDDFQELKDKKGTIQSVVVSEDVLVRKDDNRNFGVSGPKEKMGKIPQTKEEADSCWPAVYEKAFAKFLENTSSDRPHMLGYIDYGSAAMAMKAILHTEDVKTKNLSDMSIEEIKKCALNARYYPATATISGWTEVVDGVKIAYGKAGTKSDYFDKWGLYTSHVYSVLYLLVKDGKEYVILRNPHGRNPNTMANNTNVYQGKWGFNYGVNAEPEYRNILDIFRELSGNEKHQSSQGLFLLEINEFKRVFNYVTYYSGT